MIDRVENLADFVAFVTANIKGSEKSEAQTFLDRFFQSFGHGGVLEAGARYEEVIKHSSKSGKTGFCVLAMFSEDLDLLPDNLFTRCVKDCIDNKLSSFDILGGLFWAMNTVGFTPAGRYQDVQYFNGGLFQEIHPIELEIGELRILETAASADWSKVRPSIFGNIFEGAFQSDEGK
jgi:hypothetical protein